MINGELEKDLEGSRFFLIEVLPWNLLEGPGENQEKLSKDNPCPSRDSNLAARKY
jgi:hypothetical protein